MLLRLTLALALATSALATQANPTGFLALRRSPSLPLAARQATPIASSSMPLPAVSSVESTQSVASAMDSGVGVPAAAVATGAVGGNTTGMGAMVPMEMSSGGMGGGTGSQDVVVLQLAFVLENLESTFYQQALERFSLEVMVNAGLSWLQATIIIEQITLIQVDEGKHAQALSGAIAALGGTPFTGCSYNFKEALKDPITFLSTARILEATGQAAYLGAAHLLTDPALLTAAGSILTLEARHQSLLNVFNGGSFSPQSFDIALAPEGVLALAGGFLEGCQASDLGLTANNPLTVTSSTGSFATGTSLSFSSIVPLDMPSLSCQMLVGGAPSAIVLPASQCAVPAGIDGPVAVYLTSSTTPLASNILIQSSVEVVAGPGLIFVDVQVTVLSELLKPSRQGGESGSGSGKWTGGSDVRVAAQVAVHDGGGSKGSPSYPSPLTRQRRTPVDILNAHARSVKRAERAVLKRAAVAAKQDWAGVE
ncbi:hypothetical protein JCM10213_007864 [Rhodosporidiobolus nylandii]